MIGSRIAFLRWSAGLSQRMLANRLHISPSTLGMYEQGRRTPSIETLIALSQEFGVSMDYLVMGKIGSREDIASLLELPLKSTGPQRLSREELILLLIMELTKTDAAH